MPRRMLVLLAVLALYGGCARGRKEPVLPQTAAGGWRLQKARREQGRIVGTYQGPGTVRVEVVDAGSPVAAFDRAQRSRPQPDTVVFYKENYFVTVNWEQADRGALKLLVRELENRLIP